MKKIFVLSIMFCSFLSYCQQDSLRVKKQFNEIELSFIKEIYNWNEEELLLINFTQPSKNCFYDNNKDLKKNVLWFNNFYKNFNLENKKIIHVYSDKVAACKIVDNKKYFYDNDDFFYNKLFKNDYYCYGVVAINKEGKYDYKCGEYYLNDIQNLIDGLDKE